MYNINGNYDTYICYLRTQSHLKYVIFYAFSCVFHVNSLYDKLPTVVRLCCNNRTTLFYEHKTAITDKINAGCQQAKIFLQWPDKKLSDYAPSLPRRELKILVGLLKGHITLNRHSTVMKIQEDPLRSAYGEQEETSLHFLGECYMLKSKLDIPF